MRIAIIDDNKIDRDMLLEFLEKYFTEISEEYSTTIYEDAISFLLDI